MEVHERMKIHVNKYLLENTWKPEHMLDITDIKARLSDIKGDVTSSPSAAGTATLQKNAELIDNSLVNLRIMTQGKYAQLLDLAVAVPDKNVVFSAANKGMHAVMQTPLAQEIINSDEVTLENILELYQKEVIPRMALPNTQLSQIAKSSMHTAFLKYFVESSAQLGNFNELLQGYSDSAYIPMGVP